MSRIKRIEQDEEKEITIVINPDDVWHLNRLAKRMVLSKDQVISRLIRKEAMTDVLGWKIKKMGDKIENLLIEHRSFIVDLIKDLLENKS